MHATLHAPTPRREPPRRSGRPTSVALLIAAIGAMVLAFAGPHEADALLLTPSEPSTAAGAGMAVIACATGHGDSARREDAPSRAPANHQ